MSIRFRLLLLLACLTALAFLAIDMTAGILIHRAVVDRIVGEARSDARDLEGRLEARWPSSPEEADLWADETAAALKLPVTLVGPAGRVLGDSQVPLRDLTGLPNWLARPEIAEAARSSTGVSLYQGAGADGEVWYLAQRVGPAEAPKGFIRLAIPTAEQADLSRSYRLPLSLVSLLSLGLIGAVAYRFVGRLSRPIEELHRRADDVASGQYDLPLSRGSDDGVGRLASAVERMRRSMVDQIGRTESQRRLLASILGGIREGILVVNRERRVLLMNDSLRETFRVPRDVVEGTPMVQVVWDRSVLDAYDEALRLDANVRRRISIPDGRSFELTIVPFTSGAGAPAGAIGLFFDITRLDALEKVRRDFVADISHELRTPLSSVRAAAETLLAGALSEPADAERFLGILTENTARMAAILSDLTDLSLIETGAISLSQVSIDLAEAVRDAVAAISARAEARQVTVETRVPAGLVLRADRRRLDQILVNLLDNAVKFNRKGGAVIVSARRDGAKIVLTVEDTGPGIPPDVLERIFNRFFRVDRSRSQEVPGTGLGLAIVRHLVRLHGGEIHAENREAVGARFIIGLPVAGGPEQPLPE
ncbi:MAG TPA: ATP-binding protein [Candidatus Polarisedimenticolia bacterium]|nr:ATP-binding protein [Candidatus Polarisedimenticolia bacterium]